jgi:hypothetical protein
VLHVVEGQNGRGSQMHRVEKRKRVMDNIRIQTVQDRSQDINANCISDDASDKPPERGLCVIT